MPTADGTEALRVIAPAEARGAVVAAAAAATPTGSNGEPVWADIAAPTATAANGELAWAGGAVPMVTAANGELAWAAACVPSKAFVAATALTNTSWARRALAWGNACALTAAEDWAGAMARAVAVGGSTEATVDAAAEAVTAEGVAVAAARALVTAD